MGQARPDGDPHAGLERHRHRGSGSSDVYVLMEFDETLTSTLTARDGDNWSYTLHPETEGYHT